MKAHFVAMASYSAWANRRICADAAQLPADDVHKDVGVYFHSLFATLTHLLQSDRAWTHLLRGGTLADMRVPPKPATLADYVVARTEEDARFDAWIAGLDESWFALPFSFVSALGEWKGLRYDGTNASTLTHVLNHQTHHRGQAHTALTLLGVAEPSALDILVKGMLRQ